MVETYVHTTDKMKAGMGEQSEVKELLKFNYLMEII